MKKKLQTIQVEYQDLWTLLLSTIRYSMGRTTYMPEYCIDLYLNYGRKLSVGCKKQIANEIKEKLLPYVNALASATTSFSVNSSGQFIFSRIIY